MSQAFVRDGQSFFSEACATGHPNHESCCGMAHAASLARSVVVG
ncbi:hypothetical protein FZX09_01720 [Synechococcus sp. MU1643]|nr:metallothionein [Synechococcus sp. MU1643]MCB4427539.1 hypothetical protein [Synechococcus sp. MU1643]